MQFSGWHREDINALLRKRYGSVLAFEAERGLPRESVCDVLRGRTVARAEAAILEELNTLDCHSEARSPGDPDFRTIARPAQGPSSGESLLDAFKTRENLATTPIADLSHDQATVEPHVEQWPARIRVLLIMAAGAAGWSVILLAVWAVIQLFN